MYKDQFGDIYEVRNGIAQCVGTADDDRNDNCWRAGSRLYLLDEDGICQGYWHIVEDRR